VSYAVGFWARTQCLKDSIIAKASSHDHSVLDKLLIHLWGRIGSFAEGWFEHDRGFPDNSDAAAGAASWHLVRNAQAQESEMTGWLRALSPPWTSRPILPQFKLGSLSHDSACRAVQAGLNGKLLTFPKDECEPLLRAPGRA
jgi:hypothetical protein